MVLTKTGFCIISHKENDKSIKDILRAVKNAEIENKKLFKIKPIIYFVDLVYTDKEYDQKTRLYNVKNHPRNGYVHGNRIIIPSPSKSKLIFDYKSYFYHEINHIFYYTLTRTCSPLWFSEGMATYLMKTYKFDIEGWKEFYRSMNNPEKFLYYRYIKKKYFETTDKFYVLSFLTYRYLDKEYGKEKIMAFLKEFSRKPSKRNFEDLFKRYFKFTVNEIVQKAIRKC